MRRKIFLSSLTLVLLMPPHSSYGNVQAEQVPSKNEEKSSSTVDKQNISKIAEEAMITAENVLENASQTPQSPETLKILEQVAQSADVLAEAAINGTPDSPEKQIEISTAAAIVALSKEELDAKKVNKSKSENAENLEAIALLQQQEVLGNLPIAANPSGID